MGINRVTQGTISYDAMNNLQSSMSMMQKWQNQLSSGKTINKPSDDPSGAVKSMQYRSNIARTQQYSRNASDGLGWLGTADNTLTASLSEIDRVRQLVLEAANATSDPNSRQALADEIKTVKDGLIGLANTTYNNRPIFSGTANPQGQTPPVDTYQLDGTYNGNTGAVYRTVGDNASVQVNLDGPTVWGTPGANDLWHILDDIDSHLTSSDPAELNKLTSSTGSVISDLDRLDAAKTNIQNRLSEVGARYHRVETMQGRADDNVVTLQSGLSDTENADLAQTIMNYNLQSAAYQAALSATAQVIQPSLVDFLK